MKFRDLVRFIFCLLTFLVYEVIALVAFGHVVDRHNDVVMAMGWTVIWAIRERRSTDICKDA